MKLISSHIDNKYYPIARRKVYTIFGVEIWSKTYILTMLSNGDCYWTDDKNKTLKS